MPTTVLDALRNRGIAIVLTRDAALTEEGFQPAERRPDRLSKIGSQQGGGKAPEIPPLGRKPAGYIGVKLDSPPTVRSKVDVPSFPCRAMRAPAAGAHAGTGIGAGPGVRSPKVRHLTTHIRTPVAAPSIPIILQPCRTTATLLGPGLALSDPFLERVRPARGYGEIGDTGAGYFAWQADRQRQINNRPRMWTISGVCGIAAVRIRMRNR